MAHPRSRGENGEGAWAQGLFGGSSPLTRGKPRMGPREVAPVRLIPAHAGKTAAWLDGLGVPGAHPRSRGENPPTGKLIGLCTGSSPLTRGKRKAENGERVLGGLIPAHAGKTRAGAVIAARAGAHPRSRGENMQKAAEGAGRSGSSPLTRGKHGLGQVTGLGDRLIPAHAGKTTRTSRPRSRQSAHPRSRGENASINPRATRGYGSSPLTRGKLGRDLHARLDVGLIPAHAGKTMATADPSPSVVAHPRSRGENEIMTKRCNVCQGSSPLTRGKPHLARQPPQSGRLIPAHAGKTVRSLPTALIA